MTLKKIAEEVGVSVSTVSRVVNQNNPKAARKEVQDKIWEVVRRTGYVPNSAARDLQKGNAAASAGTNSLALVFARAQDSSSDPFFTQIARHVEEEAFKQNYFVKYSFSAQDITNPDFYNQLLDINVDGVVILGRYDEALLKFLTERFKNIVYTGLNPVDKDYDQVICNGYEAGGAAIKYLYNLGHRQIAYIGERLNEIRYRAYKDTLTELGLKEAFVTTVDGKHSSEFGYRSVLEMVSSGANVTSIFCANDATAIGVIKGLKDKGFEVPGDISVISIDDIETAQYISPMLTTIHIPLEELGNITTQTIISRINRKHRLPMKISLPFHIAERESCRPIAK